jgi:hypothetical protein
VTSNEKQGLTAEYESKKIGRKHFSAPLFNRDGLTDSRFAAESEGIHPAMITALSRYLEPASRCVRMPTESSMLRLKVSMGCQYAALSDLYGATLLENITGGIDKYT